MFGIYKIENKINGKVYIGQSKNIESRWKQHIYDLNNNSHHSYKLQKEWNEYGEYSFEFSVLEKYDDLDSKEQFYIDKYNSIQKGYNIVDVGYVPIQNKEYFDFAIIENNIIDCSELENNEVSIYIILKTIFGDRYKTVSSFTIYDLYDILKASSTTQRNPIKNAISELISKGYIELFDIYGNTFTDVDFSNLSKTYKCKFKDICTDYGFTKIPVVNIMKLLTTDLTVYGNIHKYKLIRYYLYIARRCSNNDLIGFVSMEKIKEAIGISGHTCTEYNNLLMANDILLYNNDYVSFGTNGNIRNSVTVFGHKNLQISNSDWQLDIDSFKKYVFKWATKNKLIKIDKSLSLSRRSKSMKIKYGQKIISSNLKYAK